MDLYVSGHRPDDRTFFYHLATHILAELLLNAGPGGNHVLRVASDKTVPDEAFASIAAYLTRCHPLADKNLAIFSRENLGTDLPEHICMVSTGGELAAIIHYPALGFTAGFRGDGSKIPPHWQDFHRFTASQRGHLMSQAADTLIANVTSAPVKPLDRLADPPRR